jgi:hypothetical protein
MALTTEQLEQIEMQKASTIAMIEIQAPAEADRRAHELNMETRRARLELLRTAKEVLIENKRNLPVSEREVADKDVITFATALEAFINK